MVDLPAPFWPIGQMDLTGTDVEVHAAESADAGNSLTIRSSGAVRSSVPPTSASDRGATTVGSSNTGWSATVAPPRTAAVKPSVENSTGCRRPAARARRNQVLLDGGLQVVADHREVAAQHDRRRVERVGEHGDAGADRIAHLVERVEGADVAELGAPVDLADARPATAPGRAPGSSGSAAASSSARRPATVSQQPMRRTHRRPPGSTIMWPNSPAYPWWPRVATGRPRRSRRRRRPRRRSPGCPAGWGRRDGLGDGGRLPSFSMATRWPAPSRPRGSAPTGTSFHRRLGPTVSTSCVRSSRPATPPRTRRPGGW